MKLKTITQDTLSNMLLEHHQNLRAWRYEQGPKPDMLDLRGFDLSGINFHWWAQTVGNKQDVVSFDYEIGIKRIDLSRVNFDGSNLQGADLRGAFLSGSSFNKCDLTRANLDFVKADIHGSSFKGSEFLNTSFNKAKFEFVDFSGANLFGAEMNEFTSWQGNFSNARLTDVKVNGARMVKSIFYGTEINYTTAVNLTLLDSDMRGAKINNVVFSGGQIRFKSFPGRREVNEFECNKLAMTGMTWKGESVEISMADTTFSNGHWDIDIKGGSMRRVSLINCLVPEVKVGITNTWLEQVDVIDTGTRALNQGHIPAIDGLMVENCQNQSIRRIDQNGVRAGIDAPAEPGRPFDLLFQMDHTDGLCAPFARALADITGGLPVLLYATDRRQLQLHDHPPDMPLSLHVFVKLPDGRYADAEGVRPLADILRGYGVKASYSYDLIEDPSGEQLITEYRNSAANIAVISAIRENLQRHGWHRNIPAATGELERQWNIVREQQRARVTHPYAALLDIVVPDMDAAGGATTPAPPSPNP